ncbi:MAG TPA: hypothetical protein VMQ52_02765 [Candidatus Saccharimonadales bacterium]|nr:hypothetical protein [Candidatus Saccharimonadales bacterium]
MSLETRLDRESCEAEAIIAVEYYLRYGNSVPPRQTLQQLIAVMRKGGGNYYVRSVCAGAYMDLACHKHTNPTVRTHLIDESVRKIGSLAEKDWQEIEHHDVKYIYRAALYKAYANKYKKALSGQQLDLGDEEKLYQDLLAVGYGTIEPSQLLSDKPQTDVRGVQFEIGVHLLNVRFNLRHGVILQSMWPSLPREDDPHDSIKECRTAWDAATSSGTFLDRNFCHYIQLKGADDGVVYDPAIDVIVGKDDLHTKNSADIISTALLELNPSSALEGQQAEAKLNMYEYYFLDKLGWQFTSKKS